MADHLHKQIRDALQVRLTGLVTSGARVYANRTKTMAATDLPGLRIAVDAEDAEPITLHQPYEQERRLVAVVECCAKGGDTLDDTLDLMSQEVEVALAAGITVAGKTVYPIYRGMDVQLEEANLLTGVKRLRFSIDYTALNNAPDQLTST